MANRPVPLALPALSRFASLLREPLRRRGSSGWSVQHVIGTARRPAVGFRIDRRVLRCSPGSCLRRSADREWPRLLGFQVPVQPEALERVPRIALDHDRFFVAEAGRCVYNDAILVAADFQPPVERGCATQRLRLRQGLARCRQPCGENGSSADGVTARVAGHLGDSTPHDVVRSPPQGRRFNRQCQPTGSRHACGPPRRRVSKLFRNLAALVLACPLR